MWKSHQKLVELPLTPEQADRVLEEAVREVRRTVVGRRIIPLFGPLGAGVESVTLETLRKDDQGEIDLEGRADPSPIGAHERETYIRVPLIYKDFVLHWRNVKWSQERNAPLDVTNAVRAAHQVGHAEDDLVFNGSKDLGIGGLLNWPGVQTLKGGAWRSPGLPLQDVYRAIDQLMKAQHHFPFALVTSLDLYEALVKPVRDAPVLEVEQIGKLCTDGVFFSRAVPAGTAALVSTGLQNFDVAVAEDLQVAYLGPAEMNHRFRVYESLVLRVKRAESICVIETSPQ